MQNANLYKEVALIGKAVSAIVPQKTPPPYGFTDERQFCEWQEIDTVSWLKSRGGAK